MPVMKNGTIVDPVDAQVGGDADLDGIAQTITADDINAVLLSSQSIDQRLEALKAMRGELEARAHIDHGGEMRPLVDELDAAIEQLSQRL